MSDQLPVIQLDLDKAATMKKEELQEMILLLENKMKEFPQIEIPLKHYFSEQGVYGREIEFTKGALIVGKIHKFSCINVLSKGEVSVLSIDGVMKFKAPHTFVSSPGAKRVIYAHEDSVWTTFHATHEKDLEKIEDEFIAKNFDEVAQIEQLEVTCLT